jgi:hypothetical protein
VSGRAQLAALILVVATVALTAVVAVPLLRDPPDPTAPPSTGPSAAAPSPSAGDSGLSIVAARGPSILVAGATEPALPVGRPIHSRSWTIDGRWWSAMVPPGSATTRIHALAEDGTTWVDTGVVLDERPGATLDTLWDGDRLVVAASVPGRAVGKGVTIRRYRLLDDGTFRLDGNFPVPLTERGVASVTVARDGSGRLWATWVQDGVVWIAHSLEDDALWSQPAPAPGSGTVGEDDVAALLMLGAEGLGLAWSDVQGDAIWWSERASDDPVEAWSRPVDLGEGLPLADAPLAATSGPDGTVTLVYETSRDREETAGGSAPAIVALIRPPDRAWASTLVARVDDRLGQPLPVLDADAARLYVFMTSPRVGGAVYLKRTDLARLVFEPGQGLPVITDPSAPRIEAVSSAKGPIALASGLVIVGFDDRSGTYWHARLGPPVGAGPSPSASAGASGVASAEPEPSLQVVFSDDFDRWPAGEPIAQGWQLRPDLVPGELVAVADGAGRAAEIRAGSPQTVRVCRTFGAVADGTLRVAVRVWIPVLGLEDTVITSLRDRAGEAVSVRFGQGGTFAYYAGAEKVRTDVPIQAGTWYRSTVVADPAAGRYVWRLQDDAGTTLLRVEGVPFRSADVGQITQLCLQPAAESSDPSLRFDDVRVSR